MFHQIYLAPDASKGTKQNRVLFNINNSLNNFLEWGWHSGESTRLTPMWPGFDSSHTKVEFVVGSRLAVMAFLQVFLIPKIPNLTILNYEIVNLYDITIPFSKTSGDPRSILWPISINLLQYIVSAVSKLQLSVKLLNSRIKNWQSLEKYKNSGICFTKRHSLFNYKCTV